MGDALAVLRRVRRALETAPKRPYVAMPSLRPGYYPAHNPFDVPGRDHWADRYDHPKD